MKDNNIFSTWEEAGKRLEKKDNFNKKDIENSISKRAKKSLLGLKFSLYTNIVVLFSIIILSVVNIWLFRSNTIVILLCVGFILLMLFLMKYGLKKIHEFKIVDKHDDTIMNTLKTKISFFKTLSFVWPLLSAFSYIILINQINMIVDCDNGTYKIYNIGRYILFTFLTFVFLFAVNYAAHRSYLMEFRNQIRELSEDYSDKNYRRIKMIFRIVVAIICAALLVFGIIAAFKYGS